jgi:hypothetical protein
MLALAVKVVVRFAVNEATVRAMGEPFADV